MVTTLAYGAEPIDSLEFYLGEYESFLNCPFCGSREIAVVGEIQKFVTCLGCSASADSALTEKEAIKKWNNRRD